MTTKSLSPTWRNALAAVAVVVGLFGAQIARAATPEGPGSVSGAPHLPKGFTETFSSRYVNANGVRLHAVIGGGLGEGTANTMRLVADNVQTFIVPESGHWVAEEAPEKLLAAMTQFLAPYRQG